MLMQYPTLTATMLRPRSDGWHQIRIYSRLEIGILQGSIGSPSGRILLEHNMQVDVQHADKKETTVGVKMERSGVKNLR